VVAVVAVAVLVVVGGVLVVAVTVAVTVTVAEPRSFEIHSKLAATLLLYIFKVGL